MFKIVLLFLFSNYILANVISNTYIVQVTEEFETSEYECYDFGSDTILCIMDKEEMTDNLENPDIIEIWKDGVMSTQACQESPNIWHLNAISELKFPPKNRYPYDAPQPSTTVYVLDSWTDVDHPEFEGRASRGPAFETGEGNPHGSHVAGLICSKTYGVNKNARVIAVQVLNANGFGSWSNIIRGMNWVNGQKKKTIVNMSIGGGKSDAVNRAVEAMVKNGWKVVVAAGNEGADACNTSPASAEMAITVGAYNNNADLAGFSNRGRCVDTLAPGEAIISICPYGRICYMSGTSMAAPIVSGIWSLHPDWSYDRLLTRARTKVIKVPGGTTDRASVARQTSTCNNLQYLDFDISTNENSPLVFQ